MDMNLFRNIARRQNPVVVAIVTKARVEIPFPEGEQWFERFFGRPLLPESRVHRGIGSGFLISRDGDILTNDHVVAGADVIEVRLLGTETNTYHARLVGRDPISDSALIRLQDAPGDLPFATLGDSDALQPGDWVMAIGNPFQLGHTVTVGVVSYEGRPFEVDEGRWQKLIQTDASINPGNSGGPLLNVRGEVVGINAAILADGIGGGAGIGFAVPINSVKALLPQLRAGKVIRGRIGVRLRDRPITKDEANALGLPSAAGVLITSVERNSPADRAGLHAGDMVIEFSGTPVATADDLIPRVSSTPPGSRARVRVIRDGGKHTLEVAVGELALDTAKNPEPRGEEPRDFGLTLGDVTASTARPLQSPAVIDGAVVHGVEDESPAARADLRRGDIVRKVNRRTIHTAAEAIQEFQGIQAERPVFLLVWREGNEVLIQMQRD
jgi:serine protease Do